MSQSPAGAALSPPFDAWLTECIGRVGNYQAAQEMWETLLTRDQQLELGDDLQAAWETHGGTIRLWQHIQGFDDFAWAAVDLAERLNLVAAHRAARLRTALGGRAPSPRDRPQWDRSARQVRFRGEIVRRVKIHRRRSKVEQLLDAFQEAGWPEEIPAPSGWDRETVRESLRSLNRELSHIRFRQMAGGTRVQWELVDP